MAEHEIFREHVREGVPAADGGQIPTPEELTDHTQDQLRDAELLFYALSNSGEDIRIDDVSADLSDPGSCSVMFVDLAVRVDVSCPPGEDPPFDTP